MVTVSRQWIFVHSSDAARANVLDMFNDKVRNEFYNVGTGIRDES